MPKYIVNINIEDPKCLVTLSGGADSTVLVHKLVREGYTPTCVYIDYGASCRLAELNVARKTCKLLNLELHVIPCPVYKDISNSKLLGNTDNYSAGSMFWLEGRNALIGLIMSILASKLGIKTVFIGCNCSDLGLGENGEVVYPDTDATFVDALNTLIANAMCNEVTIYAPWLDLDCEKGDVLNIGYSYGIDWVEYTHSCSSVSGDQLYPCMDYDKCETCMNRASDFESIGKTDPFLNGATCK